MNVVSRLPMSRCLLALLLAAAGLIATAPPAMADAAGPTDYRTVIVSIEPASDAILVEMIGGDAFLRLVQLRPVEIVILGYQAEPYLRYSPDGVVYENRRSPAVWLNQERYGDEEPPAFARADARPEWFEVTATGSYSWHDHRSHWMNPAPPPGAEPGDQVLEATVPITVNGEQVTITVASFLLDAPSPVVPILGGVIGLLGAALAWVGSRSGRSFIGLAAALGAGALGLIAYWSVPAETEPSQLLWLLPLISGAALLVVLMIRNRTATTVYLDGLAVVAGAAVAGWAIFRFDALRRALIPSDAPAALDRLVIAAVLFVGAGILLRGAIGLLRPERLMTPGEAST